MPSEPAAPPAPPAPPAAPRWRCAHGEAQRGRARTHGGMRGDARGCAREKAAGAAQAPIQELAAAPSSLRRAQHQQQQDNEVLWLPGEPPAAGRKSRPPAPGEAEAPGAGPPAQGERSSRVAQDLPSALPLCSLERALLSPGASVSLFVFCCLAWRKYCS